MIYFPWEAGGGSNNILYTKHDCISSQISMPDLPPILGRLWWDEIISTKVSRAIRLASIIFVILFAPTGLTYVTTSHVSSSVIMPRYAPGCKCKIITAAASDVDLVTKTTNADYMFEIDTFRPCMVLTEDRELSM
ncbi:hypothetical protein MKX03_017935 [Papaver bracteatum]|nr:hypothetical protein MKX03_017935 [Papaver bracteatum]